MSISDWIGLATLTTLVIGLYKVFQEARAAKANADVAAFKSEMVHDKLTAVAASVAAVVTNTNGMQRHIEALVRKEEQDKADARVAEARKE